MSIIILAKELGEIADELEDRGLSEEAAEIDEVIQGLARETKMMKSAQWIPPAYRDYGVGAGAMAGGLAGLKLGNPLAGLIGAGLGGLAGHFASRPDMSNKIGIDREILRLKSQIAKNQQKIEQLEQLRLAVPDAPGSTAFDPTTAHDEII